MIIKSEPGAVSDVEGGDDMASDSMETEAPATERAADTAADKGPPVIDEPANELVKKEPKRDERGAIVGYIDPQPATESSAMDSQSTFAGAEIIPVEKSEPSTEAALDRTATGAAEGGDPYADTRMWVRILAEATSKPLVEARESFEAVVTMFPTAGQYWRSYIEKEIGSSDEDQVLGLFSRCLTACCNRELWRLYIRFMKQIKAGTPTARTDLMNAYALATEHHGMDINAAWLWHEYISFAKTLETDNPWERVKELTEARKLYRRALGTPMHDLDSLWRDYEKFENDWGKNTAETALMKARDCYQTSKKCLRERKILWDKVSQHMLARPPASVQKGVDDELTVSQLEAWRNLIDYEKGNAQCLEEEDLLKRVSFTYNCCLVCFHHYAEIWYEAALVCLDAKQSVMARAILKRGLEALPKSPLLTFAYADFEEEQNKLNDSVAAYESLLALTKDPLIYVQYIRFARRALGVKPAQTVFTKARKADADSHHVYLCMTQIEHIANKSPATAAKIFAAGLKKHSEQPVFVKAYIDFLYQTGDDGNLRLLFEKILKVSTVQEKETKTEAWNEFLDFEYTFAKDVQSIHHIESRRASAFHLDPQRSRVASLLYRYHFEELWPCSTVEVETILKNANMQGHAQAAILAKESAEVERAAAAMAAAAEKAQALPRPDFSKMQLYQPPGGRLPGTGVGLPAWPPPQDPVRLKLPRALLTFVQRIHAEHPPQHFKGIPMDVNAFLRAHIQIMDMTRPAPPLPSELHDAVPAPAQQMGRLGPINPPSVAAMDAAPPQQMGLLGPIKRSAPVDLTGGDGKRIKE